MSDLDTVAQIVRQFYRLTGSMSSDGELVSQGEAVDDVVYEALTEGTRAAQLWMLDNGYHGWRARSSAITWLGTEAADGGRYVPLPGSNIVVNGDFLDGDTAWPARTNWTIALGQALLSDTNGASQNLEQVLSLTAGEWYQVGFTLLDQGTTLVGTITPALGALYGSAVSVAGRTIVSMKAGSGGSLSFQPSNPFTGALDDIEVRQARHALLRLYGDMHPGKSALVEADGTPWGQQIDAGDDGVQGDFYYVRGEQLWITRGATPPTTLYLDYHYAHPEWSATSAIDFPMMARGLLAPKAASIAMEENWLPGDRNMEVKIERAMLKAEARARMVARQTKQPRRMKEPYRAGNAW